MKRTLLFAGLLLFLASCNELKIVTERPFSKTGAIKEVALMPVIIGRIDQPIFPLIDAGMFNGKTNKIADSIIFTQQKIINNYREEIAKDLEKQFEVKVIYGDELKNREGYNEITNIETSLNTENKNFPKLLMADGDKMPFTLEKGKFLKIVDEPSTSSLAKELCAKLKVDAIVISYTSLRVLNVGPFGTSGNLVLDTRLYVFDKNGVQSAKGYAISKYTTINGKLINEYASKLQEFYSLNDILVKDISGTKFVKK